MATTVEERSAMSESVSQGVSHLLRLARSGCKSAVCFVALAVGDEQVVAVYPGAEDATSLGADIVDDLVRRLWIDPGVAQGRALLRTVRLGAGPAVSPRRLAVAAVPLGASPGAPYGFLGVADPEVKAFGFAELQLLSPIAQRLTSYVAARQALRGQAGPAVRQVADDPGPPPAPDRERVEPHAPAAASPLSAAALLGRTRRLLGGGAKSGSLVAVALDVFGGPDPADNTAAAVVAAIHAEVRFDDPVARVGDREFLAVVPLAPGGSSAEAVAERLTASVRAALGPTGAVVRSAHATADLAAHVDADELVGAAMDELRAVADRSP